MEDIDAEISGGEAEMKILIVDDEELTKEGIISSIHWDELNIHEILRADDGTTGLHMARKHRPDIILSDVRMPRMDGLVMIKTKSVL